MDQDDVNEDFGVFDDLAQELNEQIGSEDPKAKEIETEEPLYRSSGVASARAKLAKSSGAFECGTVKQNLANCVVETLVRPGLEAKDFALKIDEPLEDPAKTYPFALDSFQRAAVKSVSMNQSVLVAAHTSAGKTAVAEYVIAECLRRNQRVIYTSPIKALSNQKYRNLKEEFDKVGLVTGDITIDENQTCLVMTTEILRNMLFRSNEVAKETAWIIFDEVHYLKDRDRGVVWEETIILAPPNVRYCLLSATTPNAGELAEWILKVKGLDSINVVYTDYRPTPLEYWAHMPGQSSIKMVRNVKGDLINDNLHALGLLSKANEGEPGKQKKKGSSKFQDIKQLAKVIINRGFSPAIIFVFSKKDVEAIAKTLSTLSGLNDPSDAKKIGDFYEASISGLSEEDRQLPQVVALGPILKSGIGLHHGGMLPILKEIVEIMFQINLLKILVSTETFSMGVNMPVKTVVFSSVQKFDGENFRLLSGSEFVQMCGRAGRRGKDAKGQVICMLDETIDIKQYTSMLKTGSTQDPLISQFSVNYNMLLNSMILEGFEPEKMVRSSFKQFSFERMLKKKGALLDQWEIKTKQIENALLRNRDEKYEKLFAIIEEENNLRKLRKEERALICQPKIVLPYLVVGRLLMIDGCGWCVFLNFSERGKGMKFIDIDVLVFSDNSKNKKIVKRNDCLCKECSAEHGLSLMREPKVETFDLSKVSKVSQIVMHLPENIIDEEKKLGVRDAVFKSIRSLNHKLPLMTLINTIPMSEGSLKAAAQKNNEEIKLSIARLEKKEQDYFQFMSRNKHIDGAWNLFLFRSPADIEALNEEDLETSDIFFIPEKIQDYFIPKIRDASKNTKNLSTLISKEKSHLRLFIKFSKKLKKLISKKDDRSVLVDFDAIQNMKKVLSRLEYIDRNEVVTQKGRVASFIFGSDELLITELLFSGALSKLGPKACDMLLSAFVNDESKEPGRGKVKDQNLNESFNEIKKTLTYLLRVYKECDIKNIDEEEALEGIQTTFFDVIDKWYSGCSFCEVMKVTDLYEGSVIRGIKRLFELLRQLKECSITLGNAELERNFEEGAGKLCKGIVFAASLYVN